MKGYSKLNIDNEEILDKSIEEKNYRKQVCGKEKEADCEKCGLNLEKNICKKRILQLEKENIKNRYKVYSRDLFKEEKEKKKKEALISLYESPTTIVKEILAQIKKITKTNYCPYCGISSGNTIEHILPKEHFSEFSIYSNNLISCCSQCNTNKGDIIRNSDNGKYAVYNFYEDEIPNKEYLNIKIIKKEESIVAEFLFEDDADDLFRNHINQLKLLDRYKAESCIEIANMKKEIEAEKGKIVKEDIKKIYTKNYETFREIEGFNYWRGLLRLAIVNSTEGLDYLLGPYRNIEKIRYKYVRSKYPNEIKLDVIVEENGFRQVKYLDETNKIELNKNCKLKITQVGEKFDKILWQVINSGEEAEKKDDIRGQIFENYLGTTLVENTKYIGKHKIVCYGINDKTCIAYGEVLIEVKNRI